MLQDFDLCPIHSSSFWCSTVTVLRKISYLCIDPVLCVISSELYKLLGALIPMYLVSKTILDILYARTLGRRNKKLAEFSKSIWRCPKRGWLKLLQLKNRTHGLHLLLLQLLASEVLVEVGVKTVDFLENRFEKCFHFLFSKLHKPERTLFPSSIKRFKHFNNSKTGA